MSLNGNTAVLSGVTAVSPVAPTSSITDTRHQIVAVLQQPQQQPTNSTITGKRRPGTADTTYLLSATEHCIDFD